MIRTPKVIQKHFDAEFKALVKGNISEWIQIKNLSDENLNILLQENRSTTYRNLKKLRCIATLICELDLSPQEAALLIHSGFGSVKAIAQSSPNKVLNQIGRLERQLSTGRQTSIKLIDVKGWIEVAKVRQLQN